MSLSRHSRDSHCRRDDQERRIDAEFHMAMIESAPARLAYDTARTAGHDREVCLRAAVVELHSIVLGLTEGRLLAHGIGKSRKQTREMEF